MTIYRNQYGDGTYGWFSDFYGAINNANAYHPAGLRERCREIKIDTRNRKTLAESMKFLERQRQKQ